MDRFKEPDSPKVPKMNKELLLDPDGIEARQKKQTLAPLGFKFDIYVRMN